MTNDAITVSVSQITPLRDRTLGHVVGWRFRMTVRIDEASGFDDITIAIPPELPPASLRRRPLDEWRRSELQECIAWAMRTEPKALHLTQVVAARARAEDMPDFSLDQLGE